MARQEQRVIDTRIGKRAVAQDKFIHFPQGLIGFEGNREFVLLQLSDGSPFLILQSTTSVAVGLVVADPFTFIPDFEVKLGEAEKNVLQLDDIHQVAVLVTVSIPHGEPEKTALNLSGPILINHQQRVGLQVPQVDSKYSGPYFLSQLAKAQTKEPESP